MGGTFAQVNQATWCCLFEPDDGHTLVGVGQIRVGAQGGNTFKHFQNNRIEDGKFLARDKVLDRSFLFAKREGFSQTVLQGAALAGRPVAVDNFQYSHTLALGSPDFLDEHPPGFIQSREISFDIKCFQTHWLWLLPLSGQSECGPEIRI